MNSNEILNKYINLIDKGYCSDCNELNCIDNFPHSKITHAIRELQQENKILRENAEHNDKIVDKVNWENQKLKKQLENYKKLGFKHLQDKNNNLETQQQEFIKFLEDNYESTQDIWYIKILQKYKEINHIPDDGKKVGDDK